MTQEPLQDEAILLQSLTQGNIAAFDEIFNGYSGAVYNVAFRFLKSEELAQDLTQEIFTTLWVKRAEFSTISNLRAYLTIMSKNLALRYLARLAREVVAKKEWAVQTPIGENSTENQVHHKELEGILKETVARLPRQQNHVYRMVKQGLSHNEIAEQLRISPATVRNHIVAANNFIRRHIKDNISISACYFMFMCFI